MVKLTHVSGPLPMSGQFRPDSGQFAQCVCWMQDTLVKLRDVFKVVAVVTLPCIVREVDMIGAGDEHKHTQNQHWPCPVRVLQHTNILHVYLLLVTVTYLYQVGSALAMSCLSIATQHTVYLLNLGYLRTVLIVGCSVAFLSVY